MATIRFKRGTTAGSIPSGLTHGEPAVNTADEILYCGNSAGSTINITGVQTVNGATGHVTLADLVGVSTFNGASGAVTGVGSFNGLTGAVSTTSSTLHVGGLSADGGATLSGNIVLPTQYAAIGPVGGQIQFNETGNQIVLHEEVVDILQTLRHYGDTDTYLKYTTDDVTLRAGGNVFLHGTSTYSEFGGVTFAAGGATFGGDIIIDGNHHIRNAAGNSVIDFEANTNMKLGDVDSVGNDTTIHFRDSHNAMIMNAVGSISLGTPTVYIDEALAHTSDPNTKLSFDTDDVTLHAGGNEFLHGTSTYVNVGGVTFAGGGATFGVAVTAPTFVGDLTGDVTGTSSVATVATTVTITDNESTAEDNAIIFAAGGDVDGGNLGLESDGTLTYNPSTGKVTTTLLDAAINATALNINDNYNLPTGAGATGDVLMIANDGDLEFESLKSTATFIVDSDIPLATGIRYKGLFAVPFSKMDVVEIQLRSHDVSPAGSGDSLSVALKFIRRSSDLEAASPAIQGTVETVVIPLGGEYHTAVNEAGVDTPAVGSGNNGSYLVVDVVSNAGNHTNFTMLVTMEARP